MSCYWLNHDTKLDIDILKIIDGNLLTNGSNNILPPFEGRISIFFYEKMSSKITQIYYLICISTKFFTLATARDLFHLDCRYNSQDIPCPQGAGKQPSNRLRKTPTCRQQTGSWYLLGSFPTRVEFSCSVK